MCRRQERRNAVICYWWNRGQRRCAYCCVQLVWRKGSVNSATVEHLVPRSENGTVCIKNCLVICRRCNTKRKAKNFDGFVAGSQFPKFKWLQQKHAEAVAYYNQTGRKVYNEYRTTRKMVY